jgi:hypothetical protein
MARLLPRSEDTYRTQGPLNTNIYTITPEIKPEVIAKAGVLGLSTLGQLGYINKARKRQQQRGMRLLTPVQTTVAPETDIPAEALAQKRNAVSSVRSQYKGSDPSLKLISDLHASATRGSMEDQIASERAQNLIDERKRVASERAANQLRAGETQQRNIDRMQELDDFKMQSDINAITQKRKLLSETGQTLFDAVTQGEAFDITSERIAKDNDIAALQTKVNQLAYKRDSLIQQGLDYDKVSEVDNKINDTIEEMRNLMRRGKQRAYIKTSYKNGGKLVSRN